MRQWWVSGKGQLPKTNKHILSDLVNADLVIPIAYCPLGLEDEMNDGMGSRTRGKKKPTRRNGRMMNGSTLIQTSWQRRPGPHHTYHPRQHHLHHHQQDQPTTTSQFVSHNTAPSKFYIRRIIIKCKVLTNWTIYWWYGFHPTASDLASRAQGVAKYYIRRNPFQGMWPDDYQEELIATKGRREWWKQQTIHQIRWSSLIIMPRLWDWRSSEAHHMLEYIGQNTKATSGLWRRRRTNWTCWFRQRADAVMKGRRKQ